MMGDRLAVLHDRRDQILAEIVGGVRVGGVLAQEVEQEFGVEHVDAHRGERHVGLAGHRRRILGLFEEVDDPVGLVDVHHAEARRLLARDFEAADGDVRAALDVLGEHLLVVHLVDVVARQNDDVARRVVLDDVDVLIDRIRRTEVPGVFRDALARRQHVEALVALGTEEVPAAGQVPDEAVGLVLGRHPDAADARVQRVRQREVDDAGLPAEIDRRFRPAVCQLHQP